jgi:hypothetical protein
MDLLRRILLSTFAILILLSGFAVAETPCAISHTCYCGSPMVLDLDGRGLRMTDAANGVSFDLAGNGAPVNLGWTEPRSRKAWLVLDRDGNGRIDSGKELFGILPVQQDCKDANAFQLLDQYDKPENGGNADGMIDSHDAIYLQLRLWIDANHDGISQSDELFTLPEMNVTSISLDYKPASKLDRYGNSIHNRARITIGDPQTASTKTFAYDVSFAVMPPTRPRPRRDPPEVVDGSVTPERIPSDIAWRMFIRRASCDTTDPKPYKQLCQHVQQEVGLSKDDQNRLAAHLKGFQAEMSSLDARMLEIGRPQDEETQNKYDALQAQAEKLITEKIAGLKQKLSPEGLEKLNAYIEESKKQMKSVNRHAREGTQ